MDDDRGLVGWLSGIRHIGDLRVSWALGLLVTTTIVFALVADFLLLPTLLIAIDRRNS